MPYPRSDLLRALLATLACSAIALPASAVSRIDIHVGGISYSGAEVENVAAKLDMDGGWQGKATLKQSDLAQLAKQQSLPVAVSKGNAQGQVSFSGVAGNLLQFRLEAALRDIAFSDAEGRRAGEALDGRISLAAQRSGERWHWQGLLDWTAGELYWQPLYFANGGHVLNADGWLSADTLAVEQGELSLAEIGRVAFNGRLSLADKTLASLQLSANDLHAGNAYTLLLRPFLQKGTFGDLAMSGQVDFQADISNQRVKNFEVSLRDLDVEDNRRRFALYKLNAHIPWGYDDKTRAWVRYDGGQLLGLRLGAARHQVTLERYSLTAPHLDLPLLDGVLVMNDVAAALVNDRWHWRVRADMQPVSMAELSQALGWPRMEGKVAMHIPMMYYTGGQLSADGDLRFEVFDGTVAVKGLAMQEPLGLAPRLSADLEMRNLDLGLLTSTFSFGAIQGKLDGDVKGLALSSWQPVKFDASFRSSPGDYPKKISQRAVENISALGGAGAAVAIQRSFLRFFKEFNYASIGLSCKLDNGVCAMDGIAPAQSGYVIVKGSGIPAITVLGYNRSVNWGELLERVQRITHGNKPVIK